MLSITTCVHDANRQLQRRRETNLEYFTVHPLSNEHATSTPIVSTSRNENVFTRLSQHERAQDMETP